MGEVQLGRVPTIDLQDFPEHYELLRRACEEWGCFRIVNHNIPSTLMLEMKTVVRSLLDLPMEIKRRNADVIAGSGYVAPSQVNPLYEALGLYDVGSSQAVHTFCSQLDASPHQRSSHLLFPQPNFHFYC
uniref:Gibberellin 3-beta-dioxygenase n=1 Tax=Rhizophora mucronata TaxID=61149 RepID=A0A2P2JV54_RHIMU